MASDDLILDEMIRRLLTGTHTWAVVGWSPRPDRPSHRVAQFLHEHGKRVLPVNPTCSGAEAGLDVVMDRCPAIEWPRLLD